MEVGLVTLRAEQRENSPDANRMLNRRMHGSVFFFKIHMTLLALNAFCVQSSLQKCICSRDCPMYRLLLKMYCKVDWNRWACPGDLMWWFRNGTCAGYFSNWSSLHSTSKNHGNILHLNRFVYFHSYVVAYLTSPMEENSRPSLLCDWWTPICSCF